ncbi:MAG TPA: FkbM family methyltransferase [Bosea sp. (in: a-proteobacteria)]|jgi:hypothetical protein|uniref:FkbM family methyltransferase n=1 Tax=Bosea sp. (in: a-proteobacteria) TaxID=1871050 RepID=UPI002E1196E4|nr:FkbM family methyltransferase [Bosea sp. (in: a-proteobacteria)]
MPRRGFWVPRWLIRAGRRLRTCGSVGIRQTLRRATAAHAGWDLGGQAVAFRRPLDVALQKIGAQHGRQIVPKVIKLDIEGYEYHAWRGMKRTVDAAEPLALLIEFAPRRYLRQGLDPLDFLDELEAAGFSLSTLHPSKKGIRKLPFKRDTVQPMIETDGGVDIVAEKGSPYVWP